MQSQFLHSMKRASTAEEEQNEEKVSRRERKSPLASAHGNRIVNSNGHTRLFTFHVKWNGQKVFPTRRRQPCTVPERWEINLHEPWIYLFSEIYLLAPTMCEQTRCKFGTLTRNVFWNLVKLRSDFALPLPFFRFSCECQSQPTFLPSHLRAFIESETWNFSARSRFRCLCKREKLLRSPRGKSSRLLPIFTMGFQKMDEIWTEKKVENSTNNIDFD